MTDSDLRQDLEDMEVFSFVWRNPNRKVFLSEEIKIEIKKKGETLCIIC